MNTFDALQKDRLNEMMSRPTQLPMSATTGDVISKKISAVSKRPIQSRQLLITNI